jgi:hypothetical protein
MAAISQKAFVERSEEVLSLTCRLTEQALEAMRTALIVDASCIAERFR